jgi:hypothetical protein
MIIITGMHRSGTSFVSNILNEIGANFGEGSLLMRADRWNQKGYYENWEIVNQNNRLILGPLTASLYQKCARSSLPAKFRTMIAAMLNIPAFLSLNSKQIKKRSFSERDYIAALGEKYDKTLVKDLRFSLTLSEWRKYTSIDKVLYCIRHPYEVAVSLKKRQFIPVWYGLKLWQYHIQEFLEQAQGITIVMADFNNFFNTNTRLSELERLYHFLGLDFDADSASEKLANVVDNNLRHNSYSSVELPDEVEYLYGYFKSLHSKYDTLKPFTQS